MNKKRKCYFYDDNIHNNNEITMIDGERQIIKKCIHFVVLM